VSVIGKLARSDLTVLKATGSGALLMLMAVKQ
jgi:hypothetical protein